MRIYSAQYTKIILGLEISNKSKCVAILEAEYYVEADKLGCFSIVLEEALH